MVILAIVCFVIASCLAAYALIYLGSPDLLTAPVLIALCGVYLIWQKNKQKRRNEAASEQAERDRIAKELKEKEDAERERIAKEQKYKENSDRAERQRQWETKHGKISTKVAGVTYKNDDGTSRQNQLRKIAKGEIFPEISLDTYQYKGHPAIHILADGICVGNIPAEDVQRVLDVFDRITDGDLDVNSFKDDDGKRIYYASLVLIYQKESSDSE